MKTIFRTITVLLLTSFISVTNVQSQDNEWVNQVIVVNSGKFESVPPYIDYVTVQSYNPTSQSTNVFNTILTQSAQDVVIKGNMAYVAAQDSIIMYNIDNYQRVAAISDSGLSKLLIFNDKLIVTKKWPVTRFYVEVLNATNLALLARVQGISGDCSGATFSKDTIYVAVNEGYTGTEGKMACIGSSTWTLGREINFGTQAKGIWDMYTYGGNVFSVNKTPSGSTAIGSITVYNLFSLTYSTKVFNAIIGDGCGIRNNLLYFKYNGGIASFNMDTQTIENTHVVSAPMSSNVQINSGEIDYLEGNLYLQYGNRPPTFGIGIVVSSATGDSLTSYPTGINAESVAIDYRTPVGIHTQAQEIPSINIFPNPASDIITVKFTGHMIKVNILDITGRIVYSKSDIPENNLNINCSTFPAGIYFVSVFSPDGKITGKFIKQ
jgi:hypothetical protein